MPQGHSQPRHHAVVHHGQFHARLFTDDKDEGQQYGTDREIATISLLRTQPSSYGLVTQRQTLRDPDSYYLPNSTA